MVATDAQEAKALAAYLGREQAGKKIAIVFGEFFYRRAIARTIDAALSPEQKTLTRLESLADVTGASDRLADDFKKAPPDLIFISLDPPQAVEFVGKLRERGIKSLLLGGQHLLSASFWRNHPSTAEGIYILTPIESLENTDFIHAADTLMKAQVTPHLVCAVEFCRGADLGRGGAPRGLRRSEGGGRGAALGHVQDRGRQRRLRRQGRPARHPLFDPDLEGRASGAGPAVAAVGLVLRD